MKYEIVLCQRVVFYLFALCKEAKIQFFPRYVNDFTINVYLLGDEIN